MTVVTIRTRFLPYLTCVWSSPKFIVAAVSTQFAGSALVLSLIPLFDYQGHDCYPALYKYDEASGKLEYIDKIDKSEKKQEDGYSAMRKFRDMDKLGMELDNGPSADGLDTVHQNTIVELRVYSSVKGVADKLSTVSLDGQLVVWDLGKVSAGD